MGRHYAAIAFTPRVQAEQARIGSRNRYAQVAEAGRDDSQLGPEEAQFIATRESFFMATVSETGWPYMQHRGGPPGFLRVLDAQTLGFADLSGNRQHVSVGNLGGDDRVTLFLMDFANRRRLKVLGHAAVSTDPALIAALAPDGLAAKAERALLVRIAGFEWNCPQHIPRMFTENEVATLLATQKAKLTS